MKIVSRWDQTIVLYEGEHETLHKTVIAAIRSGVILRGADLCGANLRGADLAGADPGGERCVT